MYVYKYASYIYIHIYIYIFTCKYKNTYIHVYIYVCVRKMYIVTIYIYIHMYVYKYIHKCVYICMYTQDIYMGWLQLVGSLKLQVSFAKEPCKRDYILQKRPVILRSLLIVATPQALGPHAHTHELERKYRSLLQKSPIKETIFCKRD